MRCFLVLLSLFLASESLSAADRYNLFARTNLLAWCIVPFDGKKRDPEERAQMLNRLGIEHFAYDYRAEHIPTFEEEIDTLAKHHIGLSAWWFPTVLNPEARGILALLEKHKLRPQLWVMGGGDPTRNEAEQEARIQAEVERLRPIAQAAARIGCKVGLYNHGGWFGEPTNQIAIIKRLKMANVGIVYNFHHGHEQVDRFPELIQAMKAYLLAVNLNGMTRNGERLGKMILPIGQGELDEKLLRQLRASGWQGPVGILNHTDEDAETRLRENLRGLEKLAVKIESTAAGPAKPPVRRQKSKSRPPAPK